MELMMEWYCHKVLDMEALSFSFPVEPRCLEHFKAINDLSRLVSTNAVSNGVGNCIFQAEFSWLNRDV